MATLAELQAQRAKLQKIYDSGIASQGYRDQHVNFRSQADLAQALADLDQRIASAAAAGIGLVRNYSISTIKDL